MAHRTRESGPIGTAPASADQANNRRLPAGSTTVYEYVDGGSVRYRKIRTDLGDGHKTFRFDHNAADGRRVSTRGGPQILYRLDELRTALATGATVYVTEGEKDCDRLRAEGHVATTAGGANDWQTEYAYEFERATAPIIIVADKDNVGRAAAQRIYGDLRPLVPDEISIRIVTAAGDEQVNDVSDHLNAGFGLDEMVELGPDYDEAPFGEFDGAPRVLLIESIPDPFHIEPLRDLVKGLIVEDTYGEMAGSEKALKSTTARSVVVGGALGKPILGEFTVSRPFKSIYFSAEGGRNLFLRTIDRTAAAYGATVDDLRPMLRFSVAAAPVTSSAFRDSVKAELDAHQPDLVVIDPWYAYAATEADARNVYESGRVLNETKDLVCQGGTSLIIVNHFNQTGSGGGLQRISMAGHAEWCDSWWLLSHRTPPNVSEGRFALALDIGSRQWGGSSWALDYDLGRFDEDLGAHVGQMTWDARRATTSADAGKPNDLADVLELIPKAVEALKRAGTPLPRGEVETLLPGKARTLRRDAIDAATLLGCIVEDKGARGARIYRYVHKFTHDDADRWRELCGVNE